MDGSQSDAIGPLGCFRFGLLGGLNKVTRVLGGFRKMKFGLSVGFQGLGLRVQT